MSLNAQSVVIKKLITSHGSITMPSTGYSMYPAIRPKDECLFVPVQEKDIKLGDILLFYDQGGSFVGHRLVSITRDKTGTLYTCKGDTNRYPDQPVAFDQIIGKLRYIERKQRTIAIAGRAMKLWGNIVLRFPVLSIGLRKLAAVLAGPSHKSST